jgi:hypothetical protein
MRPPFSWLCHQEPLPWLGDQRNGSVIPLHAHGPNSWLVMRPPILQLGLEFIYFMGPSFFLLRSLLLLYRGSLCEASKGFVLLAFIFCQLLLPSGPLAPSSHKARYNPFLAWQTQCPNQCRGWMRGKMMKSDKYGGNGRWPFMNPPDGNSVLSETTC